MNTYTTHIFFICNIIGLIFISFSDYLLFHTLAELFSIAVAWAIFMIAWNARFYMKNTYFVIIGIAYFFTGSLDLIHTLAYKGMPFFREYGANLPTQLWIAARYLESLSLMVALLMMRRPVHAGKIFLLCLGLAFPLLAMIFGQIFPDCFIEGYGLTRFKIISEYFICLILIAVCVLLFKKRADFDPYIFNLLVYSVLLTIGAELAFTFYVSVYGLSNLIGHLFKIGSFYLIYLALIQSGLRNPFKILFRELKQYEIIADTISNPISVVDRNYVYQAVNNVYLQTLEKPRHEIVGMTVEHLLGEKFFNNIKPYLDRCFTGEEVYFQIWMEILQKEPVLMDVAYYPILDEDSGMITGAVVNARDITRIKQTEDALRESEGRFRSMFENHEAVMMLINPETGNIIRANKSAEKYYGYTAQQFEQLTIYEINQLTEEEIKQEMENAYFEKRNYFHFKHKFSDGNIRDVEVHSSPIPFHGEKLLFSVIHDITERKNAEDELAEQHANLEAVLENTDDMICSRDREGGLVFFNTAFRKIVRKLFDVEAFAGMKTIDYLPDNARKHWEPILARIVSGERYHEEFTWDFGNDDVRHYDISYNPIRKNGEIIGYTEYTRDITERRLAENQLKEYALRLKEMVRERTRELEKAQSELLLRERLAVLGHFAGSISHELRNPLAVIDSSAYFLSIKLGDTDPKISRHLGFISDNVQKSAAIIQSLLNLSRMEKPNAEKTDLAELLSETLKSSKVPGSVKVILNMPDTEIFAEVEAEQIRMALKNIIKNAVQAMNETGKLTVSLQSEDTETVQLSVADTGPGILPENLEQVFEPLFSTKTHGIGFGLSITKMIIENHGGRVRAESGTETGAVFVLTLPVVADDSGNRENLPDNQWLN